MNRTTVPKAPVQKNGQPRAGKYDVYSACGTFEDPSMETKAQPLSVQ
jgi:hypothetical protein